MNGPDNTLIQFTYEGENLTVFQGSDGQYGLKRGGTTCNIRPLPHDNRVWYSNEETRARHAAALQITKGVKGELPMQDAFANALVALYKLDADLLQVVNDNTASQSSEKS